MGVYTGVNGIAKKVSNIYFGVGNLAKKVKKAYVGINGIAKMVFNSVTKVTKVFEASAAVGTSAYTAYGQSIASTPSYFIVAGGKINATSTTSASLQTNSAEAWDTNFVKTSATAITGRFYHKAGSAGKHAVFLGGFSTVSGWSRSSCSSIVEAYDDNLIKKSCSNLTSISYNTPTAFNSQHLMTFGGGQYSTVCSTVDSYDADLVKTKCTNLTYAKKLQACTRAGEYLISAGGSTSTSAYGGCVANVEAYSNDLVKTTCGELYMGVTQPTGAWVNKYAMIIGGNYTSESGPAVSTMNNYTEDLVRITTLNFPVATSLCITTTINNGNYALVGAGRAYNPTDGFYYSDTYYVYDKDLTLTTTSEAAVKETLEDVGFGSDTGSSTMAATIGNIASIIRYDTPRFLHTITYNK